MAGRTDDLFAAITREVEARERVFERNERLNRRRAQIAVAITRMESEREADRAEIVRRAGEDRAAIERERAAEIAKIDRTFYRATTDAVAERDALAAHQARNAAADRLADVDAETRLELEHLQTALDRESRTLDTHYARRIATLADSARREETDLVTAADRAERARLAVAQIGGAWREVQEIAHQNNLYGILTFGLSLAESRFQQFIARLIAAIPTHSFYGAQTPVSLSVYATAPAAIRREVDTRLSDYFRRAGFMED